MYGILYGEQVGQLIVKTFLMVGWLVFESWKGYSRVME